ncbi:MAG: hypothetical protein V4506_17880 [Bacteroidota bacterium]
MKRYALLLTAFFTLSLSFVSCSSDEGDKAGKPAFMQKNDSISKKPAMGNTDTTGS